MVPARKAMALLQSLRLNVTGRRYSVRDLPSVSCLLTGHSVPLPSVPVDRLNSLNQCLWLQSCHVALHMHVLPKTVTHDGVNCLVGYPLRGVVQHGDDRGKEA